MPTGYSALRQKLFPSLPNPASGEAVLGFKSDGLLYKRLSGGSEILIESTGGGGSVPFDSGWVNVTWQSGWGNYGAPFQFVQYRKIGATVYLRGLSTRSSGTNNVAFYLPAGYRPVQVEIFAEEGGGGHSRVDVQGDGAVVVQSATSYSYVSMGNISFSTGETVNNQVGGMGGMSFVSRDYGLVSGPGGTVANSSSTTSNTWTYAVAPRQNANMLNIFVQVGAEAQNDVNQALNCYLEMSVNGGAYTNVVDSYTHNNGGTVRDMSQNLTAWVPFTPGQSLTFRVRIVNAGGGPQTYYGTINHFGTFFTATAASTTPYDSGWLPVVFGNVSLASGWSNYAQGWQTGRYRRIGNRVKMEGLMYYGGSSRFAAGGVVMTLPIGFRPAFQVPGFTYANVATVGERATKWNIYPSGVVATSDAIDPGGYQWLDCEFSLD